jgi:DNA-binding response OmpR family regulator
MGGGEAAMGSLERAFTILVVEDHGLIASEIEDAIRRNGGRVLGPAARVSEALALIEATPCDAALLDVRLEHGEIVYPVAERLRAKRIPFAFITGSDRDHDERYSDAPVLSKPFGEVELDRCLRMLIDRTLHPAENAEEMERPTARPAEASAEIHHPSPKYLFLFTSR